LGQGREGEKENGTEDVADRHLGLLILKPLTQE
jgi:hypothetical protein